MTLRQRPPTHFTCALHAFFVFSSPWVLFLVKRARMLVSNTAIQVLLKPLGAVAL